MVRDAYRQEPRASLVNMARAVATSDLHAPALPHARLYPLAYPAAHARATIRAIAIVSMALWTCRNRNSPSGHGWNRLRCLFPHSLMQSRIRRQSNPKPKGRICARRVVGPPKEGVQYGTEEPQGHPLGAVRGTHRHIEGSPRGGGFSLRGWCSLENWKIPGPFWTILAAALDKLG